VGQRPHPHRRKGTLERRLQKRNTAPRLVRRSVFSYAIAAATLLELSTAGRSGRLLRSFPGWWSRKRTSTPAPTSARKRSSRRSRRTESREWSWHRVLRGFMSRPSGNASSRPASTRTCCKWSTSASSARGFTLVRRRKPRRRQATLSAWASRRPRGSSRWRPEKCLWSRARW